MSRGTAGQGVLCEREPEAEDAARVGLAGHLRVDSCRQPGIRRLAAHLFLLAEDELEVLRAVHVSLVSFPRPAGCLPVGRSSPGGPPAETDGDAQSGGRTSAVALRQRRRARYVR